jgi:hypothetical protein
VRDRRAQNPGQPSGRRRPYNIHVYRIPMDQKGKLMSSYQLATTNDSPNTPGVSIAATFTFKNGTPITINSGDVAQLAKGIINFSITEPVVLGSIGEFITWLHEKFGFPDLTTEVNGLKDQVQNNPLLSDLYNGFMSFYNGTITVTVLSISRTKTDYDYKFAVTLDMNPPIDFFDVIQFDSIGISVNKSGQIGS